MKKPYKILLILVFVVLFAPAPSDAWWLWVNGVPVQEGTQLGRLAASIKEIAEQLEMIKQHIAMLKSLKSRLLNELGIGQIMEVFAEAQSVLQQAKSLASGIKDFDAAFQIQFPDFGGMKEIIKASEEGQRMDDQWRESLMLISLYILAGIMVITLIETHIIITSGAVLLGFAGFDHTRDIAFSYIKYSISAGAKILTTMVVYGVSIKLTENWVTDVKNLTNWDSILDFATTALGTSFTLVMAAKMVPSMAQSMVNGAISGFGHEQIAATATGLGRGVTQAGRAVIDTVRGARNAQTATFRGMANTIDAAKEGGAVGAAGYVATSTPGVRNLVSAAKSGGLRSMAGYVAATALFGSQSERAQKYLNEETMTPGNRSMTTVPAPGNANVSSPESVAERILRS